MGGTAGPRAVGRRRRFAEVPAPVRRWVSRRFGDASGRVEVVREHVGGMSPGCATTVRTASGRRLFVKAVGAELNEQTVGLFRRERHVLERLPAAAHRPELVDAYDDGGWVAIVLTAVDGRPPDLADAAEMAAVAEVVAAQAGELTPAPAGIEVTPLAETARRWGVRWRDVAAAPERSLPPWAVARLDELSMRVDRLPGELAATTLCHFDVRDDNLLVPASGSPVVVDWGMARLGPAWADLAMLAWQWPTAAGGERWLRRLVPAADQDTLTDLLVAFGGSQAWNARRPELPNLPSLRAFCADDAHRLLSLAALRLDAG